MHECLYVRMFAVVEMQHVALCACLALCISLSPSLSLSLSRSLSPFLYLRLFTMELVVRSYPQRATR